MRLSIHRAGAELGFILTFFIATSPCLADLERSDTDHFQIHYEPTRVSERAVALARRIAEEDFSLVADFLGADRVHSPVTLVLGGEARRPDGGYEIPRVDEIGRVLLYRYSESDESYFTALPHELVHVFRRGQLSGDWFIEEAFASYVSDRVRPGNPGFPLYGFPVDVVAGHWLARGEDIPLGLLRGRHRELSLMCMAQSYSLRLSFFRYLHQAFGKDAVLQVAYAPRLQGREPFALAFGKSFEALETEWRQDLEQKFLRIENAEESAESYRTTTPVADWKICLAGTDF